ncbi:hypothetical protein C0992_007283, partial [Termitomyces sp. T32_za158]
MSSPSTSTSLVSPAVLAAWAYVPKLDMFLASIANVAEVTWSWESELWEWCMAQYVENSGAAWLAPFEANFAAAPPSIEEQLASLLADDGPFTLWAELFPDSKVAAYVKPLVQMDLARQERQWAEAATQSATIMSAEQEAELLEERRVALAALSAKCTAEAQAAGFLEAVDAAGGSDVVETGEAVAGSAVVVVEAATVEPAEESEAPENDNDADDEDEVPAMPKRVPTAGGSGRLPVVIKRASKSTTPSKRRTQKAVPQYELPAATTFTNAQLRNLLVLRQDEVVLDNNRRARENVLGVKGKKTVSLAACDDCKARKGSVSTCSSRLLVANFSSMTNVGPTTTPNAVGTQLVPSPAITNCYVTYEDVKTAVTAAFSTFELQVQDRITATVAKANQEGTPMDSYYYDTGSGQPQSYIEEIPYLEQAKKEAVSTWEE